MYTEGTYFNVRMHCESETFGFSSKMEQTGAILELTSCDRLIQTWKIGIPQVKMKLWKVEGIVHLSLKKNSHLPTQMWNGCAANLLTIQKDLSCTWNDKLCSPCHLLTLSIRWNQSELLTETHPSGTLGSWWLKSLDWQSFARSCLPKGVHT